MHFHPKQAGVCELTYYHGKEYVPCISLNSIIKNCCSTLLSSTITHRRKIKYLCFTPSLSLLITLPRAIKLLLMCFPSFKRTPSAPVLAMRSEPAKSTKFYITCKIKKRADKKSCRILNDLPNPKNKRQQAYAYIWGK